ncbi:MAG: hypothetical protein AB7L13_18275 [Acidimicrobiia bacterium]
MRRTSIVVAWVVALVCAMAAWIGVVESSPWSTTPTFVVAFAVAALVGASVRTALDVVWVRAVPVRR